MSPFCCSSPKTSKILADMARDCFAIQPPFTLFFFPHQNRRSPSREVIVPTPTHPPPVATPGGGGGGGGSEWVPPSGLPQLDGAKLDNESVHSFIGPSPFPEGAGSSTVADENFGITEPVPRGGWGSPVSDPGSPQEGVSPTRTKGGRGSVAFGGGGGATALPKVCVFLLIQAFNISLSSLVCLIFCIVSLRHKLCIVHAI